MQRLSHIVLHACCFWSKPQQRRKWRDSNAGKFSSFGRKHLGFIAPGLWRLTFTDLLTYRPTTELEIDAGTCRPHMVTVMSRAVFSGYRRHVGNVTRMEM